MIYRAGAPVTLWNWMIEATFYDNIIVWDRHILEDFVLPLANCSETLAEVRRADYATVWLDYPRKATISSVGLHCSAKIVSNGTERQVNPRTILKSQAFAYHASSNKTARQ